MTFNNSYQKHYFRWNRSNSENKTLKILLLDNLKEIEENTASLPHHLKNKMQAKSDCLEKCHPGWRQMEPDVVFFISVLSELLNFAHMEVLIWFRIKWLIMPPQQILTHFKLFFVVISVNIMLQICQIFNEYYLAAYLKCLNCICQRQVMVTVCYSTPSL